MIQVRGLAVGFGREVLLKDVDFEVERGEIFAILGRSGCGKTTLMRSMIGLLRPLSGEVRIAGVDPTTTGDYGAPRYGVTFQFGALFGSMTLGQNVALPLRKWTSLDRPTIESVVRARLRLVGLDGYENHMPAELSGGMRKRAGIARALALEPDLLFMDEPSSGLDPVTAADVDELILALNQSLGTTMVLVTHELASVYRVASRCILLDRDRQGILAQGDPRRLRDRGGEGPVAQFFHRRPTSPSETTEKAET